MVPPSNPSPESLAADRPITGDLRSPRLRRWSWYSIGVNVVLIAGNLVVAVSSRSLAVGTEVVHNVVDLVSAVAVLVGVRLSTRKTRRFPYGLHKLENVIAVVIAILIFVTAFEIARTALFEPRGPLRVSPWMIGMLLAVTAVPLLFSLFERRVADAENSPALLADAKEYRVHALTTGLALAALASEWIGVPLDRAAALIIVVAVAKTGWDLLREGMRVLLDATLDADTLAQIRDIIRADPAVVDVRRVRGRNAGRFRFVEVEPVLETTSLLQADEVGHRIERAIRNGVPRIERVLVHPEPAERSDTLYAAPLIDGDGALAGDFAEAPCFAFVTVHHGSRDVTDRTVLPNPYREIEDNGGVHVAQWLVGRGAEVVVLRSSPGRYEPERVLEEAGVRIHKTDETELQAALKAQERRAEGNGDA
jgi:cation diffusion facilitator family transporter